MVYSFKNSLKETQRPGGIIQASRQLLHNDKHALTNVEEDEDFGIANLKERESKLKALWHKSHSIFWLVIQIATFLCFTRDSPLGSLGSQR